MELEFLVSFFGFCRFHLAREEKKKHKKPEAEKVKKSGKKNEDNKSEEDDNETNRKRKLEEAQGEKPRRGRNTELQRRRQTLKKIPFQWNQHYQFHP